MVRSAGIEPATSGFGNLHSIQLSYERLLLELSKGGKLPNLKDAVNPYATVNPSVFKLDVIS